MAFVAAVEAAALSSCRSRRCLWGGGGGGKGGREGKLGWVWVYWWLVVGLLVAADAVLLIHLLLLLRLPLAR